MFALCVCVCVYVFFSLIYFSNKFSSKKGRQTSKDKIYGTKNILEHKESRVFGCYSKLCVFHLNVVAGTKRRKVRGRKLGGTKKKNRHNKDDDAKMCFLLMIKLTSASRGARARLLAFRRRTEYSAPLCLALLLLIIRKRCGHIVEEC